jgi:hypothetical protein
MPTGISNCFQAMTGKDHLVRKPGKSFRDVLGLPEDWPE